MNFTKETIEYIKLDPIIMERYADVLVKFCLGQNNEGVKKGEKVELTVPEQARSLLPFLIKSVLDCGGIPITKLIANNTQKIYFENASDEQLSYCNDEFVEARVKYVDHTIRILCDANKFELKDISSDKIMMRSNSMKSWRNFKGIKEDAGNYSWCIGLYPSFHSIEVSGNSVDDYINNFIEICYLDEEDPVNKLREVNKELGENAKWLNELDVDEFYVTDDCGTNLTVGTPKGYMFISGISANIPSYEAFCSPDYRRISGTYNSDTPVFRNGKVIKDIKLTIEDGKITDYSASEGEDLLKGLIEEDGGDSIGEFAMTSDISRVKLFFAETLMDENKCGMHIAMGASYHMCYNGDIENTTEEEWKELGFNKSNVHTDIINSNPGLKITAKLKSGNIIDIYDNRSFKR